MERLYRNEERALSPAARVAHRGDAAQRLHRLVIALTGFCAFLDLYATQPLLPLLMRLFHAAEAQVSLTVSAATIGVAISAPFVGLLGDRFGRKPVIVASLFALTVPTVLAATSGSLTALIVWRFLQGLVMPGIFAVAMAYISEEWESRGAGSMMATYVTGSVLGGFVGRFMTGVIAEHFGWRDSFVALGSLNLISAVAIARLLPASKKFVRQSGGARAALAGFATHLRNPVLLATFAVGFNVLFSLVGAFTYITFDLADPPYHLGAVALGSVFFVYLLGLVVTPAAGPWIDRLGHRRVLLTALTSSSLGVLLTLSGSVWLVILGLAICSSGVFICQAAASSFVGTAAKAARSSATGLYVMCYYIGGSLGAVLPGIAWAHGRWPACVVLIVLVQALAGSVAAIAWPKRVAKTAPAVDMVS